MLQKCKNALLLSNVESFCTNYQYLAAELDVELRVETEWCNRYRVNEELIIAGSKYLDNINKDYYSKVVLILKPEESVYTYMQKGISRFIFNATNNKELMFAFFYALPEIIHSKMCDYEDIIGDSRTKQFTCGNYDFNFDKNQFRYKGKLIYLCKSYKKYLAEWLLNGYKDNSKRAILCRLRKNLDSEFLVDVDKNGQWQEDYFEQQSKETEEQNCNSET